MKPHRTTIVMNCSCLLLVTIFALLSLCSASNLLAQTVPDIAKMLENAKSSSLKIPRDEKSKVKSSAESAGSSKWYLNHCNQNDFEEGSLDTASACEAVATSYLYHVGLSSQVAEAAFQRACAFTVHNSYISPCAELGDLYAKRGDDVTALAVYLHAPNCTQGFGGLIEHSACLRGAAEIYRKLADVTRERATVQFVCATYYWHESCARFQQLGGSVDLGLMDKKFFEAQEQAAAADEARERENAADRAERHAESDARFNTLMGALQSMPGGSDPNAVLNAGNQQAAAIRAVGDTNATKQASQERAAAEQAKEAADRTASSGGGSPGDRSSGGKSGVYFAAIDQDCVRSFWDSKYYNWLSLENDCGQAIHLTWIARSPNDHFGASSADLAVGEPTNTGWNENEVAAKGNFSLFICPAGSVPVDVNSDIGVSNPDTRFRCKKQ